LGSSLDISPQDTSTRSRLLQDSVFPTLKDDAANLDSLEQLQAQDPLGTQIWKLFSNKKAQIPNSDRFQNLTWRMMHMNLKKLEAQKHRLVATPASMLSVITSSAHMLIVILSPTSQSLFPPSLPLLPVASLNCERRPISTARLSLAILLSHFLAIL
jgi:hypothetical protein